MFRRIFGGLIDWLRGGGGEAAPPPGGELPPELPLPPMPELPPEPEPGEERGRYEPEEIEEDEEELPGTEEWPRDEDGNKLPIWIRDTPIDTSQFRDSDRGWAGVRKVQISQKDALAYAKRIPVPTMVCRDQDGEWRVVIVYP